MVEARVRATAKAGGTGGLRFPYCCCPVLCGHRCHCGPGGWSPMCCLPCLYWFLQSLQGQTLWLGGPGSQAFPPLFPHSASSEVHPSVIQICESLWGPGVLDKGTFVELWMFFISFKLKGRNKGS